MKKQIKALVDDYLRKNPWTMNSVPVSGKVYDHKELENLIEASLEGWWTEGRWVGKFEEKLKKFLGVKSVHACNSGSSANLLAFSALCSPTLGEERIKKGDEVITVATAFPTTVNPIIQNFCFPVFVDVEVGTYNVNVDYLEKAVSDKTKAVFLAHTLGNPFNIKAVKNLCKKYNLWLIEDNCDALGSKYEGRYTGIFGDVSTLSFYPAHHITTAEGGAVITNNEKLSKIIRSVRDWGRHCWCPTGKDNTCKKRFGWKLGNLPRGYDHKYIYGELGYNLKMSDLHAAIGVAQMDKLDGFIKKRKENFDYLYEKLKEFGDYFILPRATQNSEPSWFGFLLTIKDNKINRTKLMEYLNENGIGTRLLFGGNITRQPYFIDYNIKYRQIGSLKNTDIIMNKTFWIGVYPAITKKMIEKVIKAFRAYVKAIK
jgi:CDP-6-deoxy-D-xylo-4-hexulose-3-dehydrase